MHRLLISGIVTLTLGAAALVLAEVPNVITYQGKLANFDGSPANGTHTLAFGIYSASAGGTALWSSGPRSVGVVDGLFSYQLGSNVPLPFDIMSDTSRWLGVTVGSDPEMIPRTRFTSEAFAVSARTADSVTGDHYVFNTGDTIDGDLVFAASGAERVKLVPSLSAGGSVWLSDQTDDLTAYMTAGGTGGAWLRLNSPSGQSRVAFDAWTNGSSMHLHDSDGSPVVAFDTRNSGTGAVTLPEGSIHSLDIANEPGISANMGSAGHHLNDYTMTTISSLEITIPASGYIVVDGHCYLTIWSVPTGSSLFAGVQISESPVGSTPTHPYYQQVGFSEFPDVGTTRLHVTTQRIYYKNAGSHVFNLVGQKSADLGFVVAYNHFITATYFPTSYGSVSTFATSSEAGGFESAELQPFRGDDELAGQPSEPMYSVDLRELELRAARAHAEAERAQRELLEAQVREREEQVGR